MTQSVREGQVLDAVVTLVDSLLDDFDVVELLTQLTERCAQLLDVESVGILLAGPTDHLHLMAATSHESRDLELFQLQNDEGPCLDCFATGRPVSVADLSTEAHRWPLFVPAATKAGFASVHAVAMRAGGSVLGALGLFGTTAGTLNANDLVVATTLGHIASVAILQERAPTPELIHPHLVSAITNRTVVEQAKGALREYLDLPLDETFVLLRRYARAHGEHLTEVARRLVSEPDDLAVLLAGMSEMLSGRATTLS